MGSWTCAKCANPIHALDGAVAGVRDGERFPWEHTNCEQAAAIDYGAEFDALHEAALDATSAAWRLIEATNEMPEVADNEALNGLITGIYCGLQVALSAERSSKTSEGSGDAV